MSESLLAKKSERLISLDAFRGMTIAGMILVNHPGSWSDKIYGPLEHAPWDGWTPTDLIFPFFLYIMGVAMVISFDRRLAKGQGRAGLVGHVLRRALILILLGLTMYATPDVRLFMPFVLFMVGLQLLYTHEPVLGFGGGDSKVLATKAAAWLLLIGSALYFIFDFGYFQESNLRVPGVLQRIGVVYFFASLIVLFTGLRGRIAWAVGLIVGYWAIIRLIPAPEGVTLPPERSAHLLNEWIDVKLLGGHIYRERPDPEGLLSTLPAIATTLMGVLTGMWLMSDRDKKEKALGLLFMGNVLIFVGECMHPFFPINKKIWSSSYVVFMAGMGLDLLAMCYFLIDIKGVRKWAEPFVVFGTNAILVFFAAHLVGKLAGYVKWTTDAGVAYSLRSWPYKGVLKPLLGEANGSLVFAVSYVLLWLLILIPFYKKKIFIKI